MDTNVEMAKGVVERIGLSGTHLFYETMNGISIEKYMDIPDIQGAITHIILLLQDKGTGGVIRSIKEIAAVGHRVVHGGEKMTQPVIINHEVEKIIKDCYDLAPLHNPSNLNRPMIC